MPDWNVVADVSETLRGFLATEIAAVPGAPPVLLHDLQPAANPPTPSLTLFIFEIIEDSSGRNKPRLRSASPPSIKKPPMALLLRYLVTPWGGDALTDHRILGRVLQAFYENTILSGPQLAGGLSNTVETLKITLAPLTLEERSRIWYAIQRPYRLSLTYEVRLVNLEAEDETLLVPTTNRSLEVGVPELVP